MERLLARAETCGPRSGARADLRRSSKVAGLYGRRSRSPGTRRAGLGAARALLRRDRRRAGAFDAYGQAFALEPSDRGTLEELAALAARTNRWADLTRAVEAVLAAGSLAPEEVRELNLQAAEWYEERLADLGNAEKRLRGALEADAESTDAMARLEALLRRPGRERDLVDLLCKRAELDLDVRAKRERLLEAARLAEAVLGDAPLVEQIYRICSTWTTTLWPGPLGSSGRRALEPPSCGARAPPRTPRWARSCGIASPACRRARSATSSRRSAPTARSSIRSPTTSRR
jgi:hypothetical protein